MTIWDRQRPCELLLHSPSEVFFVAAGAFVKKVQGAHHCISGGSSFVKTVLGAPHCNSGGAFAKTAQDTQAQEGEAQAKEGQGQEAQEEGQEEALVACQ